MAILVHYLHIISNYIHVVNFKLENQSACNYAGQSERFLRIMSQNLKEFYHFRAFLH